MFEDSTAATDRIAVRRGVRAAVLCFATFGLFDLWLFPDIGTSGLFTRVLVGLFFLGVIEIQIAGGYALRSINLVCATGLVVASFVWLEVMRRTTYQDGFVHFLVFGTVFVISSSLFFRFRFLIGATCSSIITLLFCLAAATASVPESSRLVVVAYFVNFLGFSLYLSWQLATERYVTFLNATQARLNETAVREKGHQLSRIANTDHLTGLRNRRAVVQEYGAFRDRWIKDHRPIGVLLIDVDHFKMFNDHYGHQSGDNCLIDVGRALQMAASAGGAVLGRYGGEEFLAFCHVEDEKMLFGLAEAMRVAVASLAVPHSQRPDSIDVVTVSIGVSLTRRNASPDLDRLSGEADKALYSAKSGGRNRTHVFDPIVPLSLNEEQTIAELLSHAATSGLLSMAYQPIVDLVDGQIHSVEALMRLRDHDGASISPAVFIPVAERTGLIVEMGRWAVHQACVEVLAPGMARHVSVNVSAVQLRASSFALHIAEILVEFGLEPSALALEVTEGADILSDDRILETIEALKALGVQIWLDDFGTGFAGLSWLQSINFDVVKVDRSFLHQTDTRGGALFLRDILQLLRHRGVSVVVEGVETEEQLIFLKQNGVRTAQGFYLSRPVAATGLPRT